MNVKTFQHALLIGSASMFMALSGAASAQVTTPDQTKAQYNAEMRQCDRLKGNEKDVCEKQAEAKRDSAKADAKAGKEQAEARHDAAEEKRDAQYDVAKEKCDAMSGDAKDQCIAEAKTKYNK